MPSFPIYVLQDGPDFYVYDSPVLRSENLVESLCRTYPHPVGLDLERAMEARKWFIQLCSRNQVIHWPNPFEGN
jgi:hypothetical protein